MIEASPVLLAGELPQQLLVVEFLSLQDLETRQREKRDVEVRDGL